MLDKNVCTPKNMLGQGYYNGSNVRGDKSEVQTRTSYLNFRTFNARWSSHSLNLVVNDIFSANFFNIIQTLYEYIFSSSTSRWAIFLKYIHSYTLKPLSNMMGKSKWFLKSSAVSNLKKLLRFVEHLRRSRI